MFWCVLKTVLVCIKKCLGMYWYVSQHVLVCIGENYLPIVCIRLHLD